MRKFLTLAALAGVLVVGSACGANTRDLENIPLEQPTRVRIWANIDKHPNIALSCIEGIAWATTTRVYGDALTRVPEWDRLCHGGF